MDQLGLLRALLLEATRGRGPLQPSPGMNPQGLVQQLQMREATPAPAGPMQALPSPPPQMPQPMPQQAQAPMPMARPSMEQQQLERLAQIQAMGGGFMGSRGFQ